jgi:hypothetical protein
MLQVQAGPACMHPLLAAATTAGSLAATAAKARTQSCHVLATHFLQQENWLALAPVLLKPVHLVNIHLHTAHNHSNCSSASSGALSLLQIDYRVRWALTLLYLLLLHAARVCCMQQGCHV